MTKDFGFVIIIVAVIAGLTATEVADQWRRVEEARIAKACP